MRRIATMLGVAALLTALSAGGALAASITCPNSEGGKCFGTVAGDGLFGNPNADVIFGFGGADLIRGFGGSDILSGGNEIGFGDKILGGNGRDRVLGEGGDDALYGEAGNDTVKGGAGNDIVVGGPGNDILGGGPGGDKINARDGERDTILICGSESDRIFYDRGLDVLQGCIASQGVSSQDISPQAELVDRQPPEGLFGQSGKVLLKHEGQERCVAEKELKPHLKHGDEIVNPAGCSSVPSNR